MSFIISKQLLKWFLSIVLLLVLNPTKAQVLIRGTVNDSLQREVVLYEPIDGFYNDCIKDSAFIVDILNDNDIKTYMFERHIDLNSPMMLCLSIGPYRGYFVAFPKDTIEVTVNVNNAKGNEELAIFNIKGANAEGNNALNTSFLPFWKCIDKFYTDLKKVDFFDRPVEIEIFDSVLQKQSSYFDDLLSKRLITGKYNLFVKRMISYSLVTHFVFDIYGNRKYTGAEKKTLSKNFNDHYQIKEDDPVLCNNQFSSIIASVKYMHIRALSDNVFLHAPQKRVIVNSNNYFIKGDFTYWLRAPDRLKRAMWAFKLVQFKRIDAGKYSQKDVEAYLAYFPDSPYKKYLVPPHFGLPPWSSKDSSNVKFIIPDKNDNLDSLMNKYFKGKNVLLDLWATWCVPCKAQFLHVPNMDKFCEENNIEKLYISLDRIEASEDMKNDIYGYQLKGVHIMATHALEQDIIKKIYDNSEYASIPRFIFIDSTGAILSKRLPLPADEKFFYRELGALLLHK